MNRIQFLSAVCLLSLAAPFATITAGQQATPAAPPAKAVDDKSSMTEGEVKKVDKDAGKVTIKHGEIKNLDMPAMTMVFRVKDAALLDKAKAGDKIKFRAEKTGSGYAVTEIEAIK